MKKILMIALSAMLFAASVSAASAMTLNAAGATFPYPLYSKWFYSYAKQTGTKINYAAIGSGAGIQQIESRTVDFGCSDAPLKAADQKKNNLFMFPTVGGAVAIAYNLPGIRTGLMLLPSTIADIYLGKVKKWNDPEITRLNPRMNFPNMPIIVVHRSDGSGTTNIFTWFLSDISPEWRQRVGSGTSVNWPVGLGGKGNQGVAGTIQKTRGAFGYVELAYVLQSGMTYAALKNKSGNWVYPTLANAREAAGHAKIPSDFYIKFTNSPGKNSYPIAGFTFMLIPKNLAPAKAAAVKNYVKWAYTNGDRDALSLDYVPLPAKLKSRILNELNRQVR